jgi:succinate dehydrogenase / fumarate reductase cytochrome b subunit
VTTIKPKPRTGRAEDLPVKRPARRGGLLGLWQSSIGKKWVMAVTGLLMMLFLLVHMIGEPVLHGAWYLWIQRAVLLVALVLHITAAAQLSKRDLAARPVKYSHGQRAKASFATHSMRYGGIVLGLFIIWHLLDLTAGLTNPDFKRGYPYHNILVDFQHWWINLIYIVAMVMLGLHINHGFWSASQTLGINSASRDKAIKAIGSTLAVVISVGFIMVPVGVMTGIVK